MAQQSSRLHRLLTLLDTGSTQATRFAAAQQIGDIAKSHPQDLHSLWEKVSQYLSSKNWDTRVAAAQAIGAIAANVKHTSLKDLFEYIEKELVEAGLSDISEDIRASVSGFHPNLAGGATLRSFDINKVLDIGLPLLASGGQEYDVACDTIKNPAERLARQKQNISRRLGFDLCEQFMDVSEMIKDEDLLVQKGHLGLNGPNNGNYVAQPGRNFQHFVADMVPNFRPKRLSAREVNLLKRKAKVNAKDNSKCRSEDDKLDVQYLHNPVTSKATSSDPLGNNKDLVDAIEDEDSLQHESSGEWPFRRFVEQLINDMFDPVWEVRHGSIMALREILTYHGSCAGVLSHDLNSDRFSFTDLDEKSYADSMKSGREIDLNVQFEADQHEPTLKRRRTCEGSVLPSSITCSVDMQTNFNADTKMDGIPCDSFVNGGLGIAHVKLETGVSANGTSPRCKVEDVSDQSCYDYGSLIVNMNLPIDLSQSSKLMKLIKLTRYSWIKNWDFLQDCAIRFLCILCLDRFGDYVSDQVVAPVRETCAQALGAVLKYMHPSLVYDTLKLLLQMQHRHEWEVRHGCLLGIKYFVAVRPDLLQDLLVYVLPACKAGLEDADDDVREVAAEALIPMATSIVSLDDKMLHSIVMLLWDILLDLDDLSPSTSSVMNLLSEIYSQPAMIPKMLEKLKSTDKQELDLNQISASEEHREAMKDLDDPYILSSLTPRLWPFMRHSITSVRRSAMCTLERLLEVGYRRNCFESAAGRFWPASTLSDALRIVFQNLLLESNDDIIQSSKRVWRLLLQCPVQDLEVAALSYFPSWLQLGATAYGSPLDPTKMFWPVALPHKSRFRAAAKMRAVKLEGSYDRMCTSGPAKEIILQENNFDVSAPSTKIIVGADSEKSVAHTRVTTAEALGIFASKLPESSLHVVIDPIRNDLLSLSGVQRQVAAMVLVSWFKELKSMEPSRTPGNLIALLDHVRQWLLDLLTCLDPAFPTKDTVLPYSELSRTYAKMRNEARLLIQSAGSPGLFQNFLSNNINTDMLSLDDAINLALKLSLSNGSAGTGTSETHSMDDIAALKERLLSTAGYLKCVQNNLHVTVSASVAAAVVWMSELPIKLNPVILPLMAAVKREQEELLQRKAAEALAELIFHCIGRRPSPNDKLIKNLCNLTCSDPNETPQAALVTSIDVIEDQNLLSLGRFTGYQKTKGKIQSADEDRSKIEGFISRRGSELALEYLCKKFGSSLFDKLPKLWDCLTEILKPLNSQNQHITDDRVILDIAVNLNDKDPQALINNIQVVRSVSSTVNQALHAKLLSLLPCILGSLRHQHIAVRLTAARCITSMAKSMPAAVMGSIISKVIPMLADSTSVQARQGAGMLVTLLVQGLGVELVPYAPLLVVPLLKCMSDCNIAVRQSVTHSFAALVPLLPLARGLPPPTGLSDSLSRNTEDAQFLEQLLDNTSIDDYKLPVDLKVTLRRYQKEGVNWLSFLRRFKLHGILCDDMGLGKTLQASAIVASDIVERRATDNEKDPLSLIICPTTLVGHWAFEIEKFIEKSVIITLQYVGSVQERMSLQGQFGSCNVVITSYDVVRKDIDYLGKLAWNYCILDEGHIIKNPKSKITSAVKQLKAEHRLILSGTPIQNNVLELWSLFDFLMPGFLGTEKQFQTTYGKPLLAAKDSKCSAKDAEAGVLAMEALHKQVMPFLLRRTKEEVLSDLPEKIIQDRYCDLSPVQLKLYEQFSSSGVKREISTLVEGQDTKNNLPDATSSTATSHVFQALQYLLKLCSHPLLVVGDKPSDCLQDIIADSISGCTDIFTELHALHHSPKLVALQEILEECGIGLDASSSDSPLLVGHHRVLVFAQHRSLLDIIERDLFQTHMKSVTYLRLDGSVEQSKRFEIVKTFNSDPTIDVLLLTTNVGGLGLNLTSADTIIFMEHDWNPMKDHQAMDRAHRLGQRKVVNVHRLIMRGTLEEKVMSLQKFKVSIANAVINAENASLKTMNTDQLLDLFTPSPTTKMASSRGSNEQMNEDSSVGVGGKASSILKGLGELWDQSQYDQEYNLSEFLAKLNS